MEITAQVKLPFIQLKPYSFKNKYVGEYSSVDMASEESLCVSLL